MNKKFLSPAGVFGFILPAALLIPLTGCVGYVEQLRGHYAYVAPAPVLIEQDDFVYYPRYGMYYGNRSHRYYYQDGRSWVARPSPRGVSVDVLFSSPSVALDFHDGPAAHHAQVVRSYPKHWTPQGGNHARNNDRQNHDNR